ncbi:wax ester/triacylglycerol synthase family O-acyltransferase [Amycolatopsis acidicola]|uniref:Diacylglycerol O-acyltransferase n=1 Tax=Amycolatopsis acidicola TaxID=2596893 RepID=A0A5N0V2I4_9PSEU|nr:wax ester/triacylglycerol synthase family O-acyltransferase [Amycolatopsis acidicola]KAA9160225.1 wax ester/triacylglycerol synthase family O-acyltransferase [Amycolatopsis acidicola]
MDTLSPLDAAFLEIEDAEPESSLAIASIAVLEGPVPAQEELVTEYAARLPQVPRYRQRMRRVPFDLGPPVWADDPGFDPAKQFERIALPAPGDEGALCELVGLIMSERMDRSRPLWQCWVVEGLPEGRWALVSKIHHSLADGVSASALHELFFRVEPAPPAPVWQPEDEPGPFTLLGSAVRRLVTGPFTELPVLVRTMLSPERLARRIADTARGMAALATALVPAASSSLTGPVGRQRHYELAHTTLADLLAISRYFRVTLNDVALAAVTGALRAVLLDRGEDPAADTVRSLVPVSVRDSSTMDNQISLLLPVLPVDLPDPVERLTAVHRRLTALKREKEAEAGLTVTTTAAHGPFPPVGWALRAAAKLPQRAITTVTTNVPGPAHRLSLLGREVVDLYPYVPIAVRLRTGIAILSYAGKVTFGITADVGTAPKAGLLSGTIEQELGALRHLAGGASEK